MQAERGRPLRWQRASCLEAEMQEESSCFGLPQLGADNWPPLQVPPLFPPSNSPSVKAAVNPRDLPCTHPLYLIHFSKRPLSPLPSHQTLPAAHWLHSAGACPLQPHREHQGVPEGQPLAKGHTAHGQQPALHTQDMSFKSRSLALGCMQTLHSVES